MQNGEPQITRATISLKDMAGFFKRNKWPIVLGAFAGLLFAAAYVVITPKKYEARGQLQMAFFGANAEEPAALIQRLRYPTTYPLAVQQSCGMPQDGEFGDYLSGALEIQGIKNVANAVEMKVRASSADRAKKCAEAVAAMIVVQQRNMIEERLAGRHEQLIEAQKALQREMQLFDSLKRSENGSIRHLAKLERIGALNARIDALQDEALMAQKHPAKLTVPFAASSHPVSPRVRSLLSLGILLGLMCGVLYALGREGWRKLT